VLATERRQGERPKLVRLELAPPEHKQFRTIAANQETSMSALARKLVEQYVASHTRKETACQPRRSK